MKEQIFCLKNKLTLQDHENNRHKQVKEIDSTEELVTYKQREMRRSLTLTQKELQEKNSQIKQYKSEIEEMSKAIRVYERDYEAIGGLGSMKESRSLLNTVREINFEMLDENCDVPVLNENMRATQRERIRAQENAEYYKTKCESISQEMNVLKENLMQTTTLKLESASLKGEFGNIENQLSKKEELLKASNKRFQQLFRKVESLEKDNKVLEGKNKLLEADKKKMIEKWQNLLNRVKSEDKLKARNKELEDDITSLKEEYEKLQEDQKNLIEKENTRYKELCSEKQANLKAQDTIHKLKHQFKSEQELREVLAEKSKELSVIVHNSELENNRLREDLNSLLTKRDQMASDINHNSQEMQLLQEAKSKLEATVNNLDRQLSQIKQALKDKDALIGAISEKYEAMACGFEAETRRSTPMLRSSGVYSSGELAIESVEVLSEKYDRLIAKYQLLEEENVRLNVQMTNLNNKLKSYQALVAQDNSRIQSLESTLKAKQSELSSIKFTPFDVKSRVLAETHYNNEKFIKDQMDAIRTITPTPTTQVAKTRRGSMHTSPKDRKVRVRSSTPDDAQTPRYQPLHKPRLPCQAFDRPWRFN